MIVLRFETYVSREEIMALVFAKIDKEKSKHFSVTFVPKEDDYVYDAVYIVMYDVKE